ncbi:golgin candidate 2 [Pyrus ussuriensis x Pyrus communis]|uniref:Golgin candidate 2 n=1 Tax=Pyrus ussuriensis x Pyrus communis TaxID=2448454 RepID=A0A5N5F3X5_9ROSA|nr:golgin candidate 2 [Pyrus ussuriensis x Pyrus communis]
MLNSRIRVCIILSFNRQKSSTIFSVILIMLLHAQYNLGGKRTRKNATSRKQKKKSVDKLHIMDSKAKNMSSSKITNKCRIFKRFLGFKYHNTTLTNIDRQHPALQGGGLNLFWNLIYFFMIALLQILVEALSSEKAILMFRIEAVSRLLDEGKSLTEFSATSSRDIESGIPLFEE